MQMFFFKRYWKSLAGAVSSSYKGLLLTIKHLIQAGKRQKNLYVHTQGYFSQTKGLVTLTYPTEVLPVPDLGRYQLYNEIEDCIVCDKCAEVCPVNCIEIEAIKAGAEIRKTSDGHSVRLHTARFDIDMAKCCFCGLCTTVCPTECLTMTPLYDFSTFDVTQLNVAFSKLSPQEIALLKSAAPPLKGKETSTP
jgi:formate hydrogenlyase subunit 6/NADH:ubiquinone oxidoreductase subunit I